MSFSAPGVYVVEESNFPPSVAEVASAVPVFLGLTETAPDANHGILRIASLRDFEANFGGSASATCKVTATTPDTGAWSLASIEFADGLEQGGYLYDALKLYFMNGGGPCYIAPIGRFDTPFAGALFTDALARVEKLDAPTLIVMPEAVDLEASEFQDVCTAALAQCRRLQDRFAILDVPISGQDADAAIGSFRNAIGTENLSYGAAYYPKLDTSLTRRVDLAGITVVSAEGAASPDLATIRDTQTLLYNDILKAVRSQRLTLPPSAAIAGVYANVDRTRGVWKAPANVALAGVIAPTVAVSNADQAEMNVHTSGKSINAIRSFTDKGVLVWGARTLAGNDANWRYINVRRLFLMIEESIQKATAFAVFEPNDATTWLKVKGMAESYLYGLWEQGALQGSKPEQAFYVRVGLNKTMTAQDVLDGKMIVDIGVAAVRPAEFIVLRFEQLLAQA